MNEDSDSCYLELNSSIDSSETEKYFFDINLIVSWFNYLVLTFLNSQFKSFDSGHRYITRSIA